MDRYCFNVREILSWYLGGIELRLLANRNLRHDMLTSTNYLKPILCGTADKFAFASLNNAKQKTGTCRPR